MDTRTLVAALLIGTACVAIITVSLFSLQAIEGASVAGSTWQDHLLVIATTLLGSGGGVCAGYYIVRE